jgi:hypothetical protein
MVILIFVLRSLIPKGGNPLGLDINVLRKRTRLLRVIGPVRIGNICYPFGNIIYYWRMIIGGSILLL